MDKDDIFTRMKDPVPPFEFNEGVVRVFDDMIHRSVPGYEEILRRQAQLTALFYQVDSLIYDLGCSNGNFGFRLCQEMGNRDFSMIAVDNSPAMLQVYRERLAAMPCGKAIRLVEGDLGLLELSPASVVVINLTLQFLPVEGREDLLNRVFHALLPGGILLLTEKVVHENADLNALQQDFYYRFKKERGYSELEISRKREALERVLIPESLEGHLQRLQKIGFRQIDVWFKWFNFAALICRKEPA
ncbi:MAG: carboxy-S-adenosyl-L-methionine synthase CmoA [Syntrophotaleaceae bacterium]